MPQEEWFEELTQAHETIITCRRQLVTQAVLETLDLGHPETRTRNNGDELKNRDMVKKKRDSHVY